MAKHANPDTTRSRSISGEQIAIWGIRTGAYMTSLYFSCLAGLYVAEQFIAAN